MPYQYKREPLTQDEATRLANACETHAERLTVWTLLDTGLRVSELAGLRRDHIDWETHRLTIYGKGGPYACARNAADLAVVDCPPHIGVATSAAFLVADLVVVPVTASGADLLATGKALNPLREARTVRQDGKPACLMVPSRVDRRTGTGREIEAALRPFGEAVGQRSTFVDAFIAGQWIGQHAPNSKANTETAALAAAVARRLPQ